MTYKSCTVTCRYAGGPAGRVRYAGSRPLFGVGGLPHDIGLADHGPTPGWNRADPGIAVGGEGVAVRLFHGCCALVVDDGEEAVGELVGRQLTVRPLGRSSSRASRCPLVTNQVSPLLTGVGPTHGRRR